MPRSSSHAPLPAVAAMPTRRGPAPLARVYADAAIGYLPSKTRVRKSFSPAADDPLLVLELQLTSVDVAKAHPLPLLTGHGKPLHSQPDNDRRTPARRASFRTPPR